MMTMPFLDAQIYVSHLNNDAKVFCPMKITLAKCNVSTGTTVLTISDLISVLFLIVYTRSGYP